MKRTLRATAFAALFLLLLAFLAPRLGRWLVVEDPLDKADVIYVLSGTIYERPLEAVDLVHGRMGAARVAVDGVSDWGDVELASAASRRRAKSTSRWR